MKQNYIIGFIIFGLFLFIVVTFITMNPWNKKEPSQLPSVFTKEDIVTVESFVHFKFPDSTKIIKTYWDLSDSSWLYMFFEFDEKDVELFKESLNWDKAVENVVGDMNWRKVQSPEEIASFAKPVIKVYYPPWIKIGWDRPSPSEELEWWRPNKENIDWIFEISQAKLKNVNVVVNKMVILLEKEKSGYRVYVIMAWDIFEGAEVYIQRIQSLFPFNPHWEYRIRESKINPMLQDRLSES